MEKDEELAMDSSPEEEITDAPTLEQEPSEVLDRPRDGQGRFAPKETGEAEPQGPEATPATENPIPEPEFKGYLTEKRKRQELEQQVAAMQAQLAARPTPEAPTDFFENPDAFLASKLDQFGTSLMQRFQQQQQVDRLNASEAAAKAKYADYDDAFHAFRQAVQSNPALSAQMTSSPDPADFAYRTGKRALDLERVGSFDELVKAEREKWEAEMKAAMPARTFPASTASDGSVAGRGGPVWAGPIADRDILPMG